MTPNPEQDPGEMREMMQEYQKQSAHMEMNTLCDDVWQDSCHS